MDTVQGRCMSCRCTLWLSVFLVSLILVRVLGASAWTFHFRFTDSVIGHPTMDATLRSPTRASERKLHKRPTRSRSWEELLTSGAAVQIQATNIVTCLPLRIRVRRRAG